MRKSFRTVEKFLPNTMLLFLVTPQILPVGSLVFALIAEKFYLKQLSFHTSTYDWPVPEHHRLLGLGHQMNIFLKACWIIPYFLFLTFRLNEKIIIKFLLASLKKLTNSKNVSKAASEYLIRLWLIGWFSPASDFTEASKNFIIRFLNKKAVKYC